MNIKVNDIKVGQNINTLICLIFVFLQVSNYAHIINNYINLLTWVYKITIFSCTYFLKLKTLHMGVPYLY